MDSTAVRKFAFLCLSILNFLDKNVAAELVLTVPQKHTVSSSVLGADLGALTNLRKVSHDEVNEAVYRLNRWPRTCLGYRTRCSLGWKCSRLN